MTDSKTDEVIPSNLISVSESSNNDSHYNGTISKANFGVYLTNQYELLERTLSFLTVRELSVAANVCKAWKEAKSHIMKKRVKYNKFRWHHLCSRKQHCENIKCLRQVLNYPVQLLLVFGLQKDRKSILLEVIKLCDSFGGKRSVFFIETSSILVPFSNSQNIFSYFECNDAAINLPYKRNFTALVHSTWNSIEGQIDENLKGILLFTNMKGTRDAQSFCNRIVKQIGQPVPVGGGIFHSIRELDKYSWSKGLKILCISFHGNFECYSDVLTSQNLCDIEPFMKQMNQHQGNINPHIQQRIAFVIQCCGKYHRDEEISLFNKYFPDTAAFFMLSNGEYGYRLDSRGNKRKKIEGNINYSYSSVYFFITVDVPER